MGEPVRANWESDVVEDCRLADMVRAMGWWLWKEEEQDERYGLWLPAPCTWLESRSLTFVVCFIQLLCRSEITYYLSLYSGHSSIFPRGGREAVHQE